MSSKNGRCEQLDRAGIKWERADYGAEKTALVIKRPFSKRFAYWAGRNGKSLFQSSRFNDESANAWARGWQDFIESKKE